MNNIEEKNIHLYVNLDQAFFKQHDCIDYLSTYPIAPPSTTYGMLLSFIGEYDKEKYIGTEISTALTSSPTLSKEIFSFHRLRNNHDPIGQGQNKLPKYIEYLYNNKYSIWVRDNTNRDYEKTLIYQLKRFFYENFRFERYGILSYGTSDNIIDSIELWKNDDYNNSGKIIKKTDYVKSDFSFTKWVEYPGFSRAKFVSCALENCNPQEYPPEDCWIKIENK